MSSYVQQEAEAKQLWDKASLSSDLKKERDWKKAAPKRRTQTQLQKNRRG